MLFHETLSDYIAFQKEKLAKLEAAALPDSVVIAGVYRRTLASRQSAQPVASERMDALEIDARGVIGGDHHNDSRPSGGRELSLYPRSTVIRHRRQLCVVSRDDCEVLSQRLGVAITPEMLGANLMLDGIEGAPLSLAQMPRGTHLIVQADRAPKGKAPPRATLVHHVNQRGCGITGKSIADHYGDKALVKAFREASTEHRGILCSVDYPVTSTVTLEPGMRLTLKFPLGIAP
jgi:hypothetical protein